MNEFNRLVEIIQILRSPEGCQWDREQTFSTTIPNLLEETYEVIETIEDKDFEHLKEELGDLACQIVFLSQIAEEQELFKINDVLKSISDKLVRRHPHVFGEKKTKDTKKILQNWEKLKKQEKNNKNRKSILDGIPKTLPALEKAQRIQSKASRVGFDWKDYAPVIEKIFEEVEELKNEIHTNNLDENTDNISEEIGDLLFSIVNLSRFLKIDAEFSLHKTINKFYKRFNFIEKKLQENGKDIHNTDLEEMDKYWEQAKKLFQQ